ncbi:GGDEF domain-containing protein [Cytobacillus gottheilii]|uniref:GGDEF domain-containing protein n=1 Tax=Cytobacillus gottheilii TaxID=859144 RepID=UPI002148CDEE|nr:diguanylate cyclase [Cytobacillus gottheilii]
MMIIKEFIANLALLGTLLFLYSQVIMKKPLHLHSAVKMKIIAGLSGGVISIVLMLFSINIGDLLVDLRFIPTLLLAFYGGAIPALISMTMTIICRFIISTDVISVYALIISVTGTLFGIFFSRVKISAVLRILSIYTFNNMIFSIFFIYLSEDTAIIKEVLIFYWLISYISTFLTFYLIRYIRESQALFAKYKNDSLTDSLTGLNNVRKFDEEFNRFVQDVKDSDQQLSLLYIDIDYFKKINDTYGHKEGDIVLIELGARLQKATRSFDIVSRNGGEEFTVLLLDCPSARAVEIAERIRVSVEKDAFLLSTGKPIYITVSIGVASYRETTDNPSMLIDYADTALYQAKHVGRNRVCVAS